MVRIAPLDTSSMTSIACEEASAQKTTSGFAIASVITSGPLEETRPPSADAGDVATPGRRSSVLNSLQKHQAQLQLRQEAVEIRLATPTSTLCWIFVVLVHATLAVFYFCVVRLHRYLQLSKMEYFVECLSADLYNFFDAIIVANWILWVYHIYAILCAIGYSLYYRQLVFGRHRSFYSFDRKSNPTNSWTCFGQFKALEWLYGALSEGFAGARICFFAVCGRKGFFGVEGRHFNKVFLLRELLAIALQTYQAWKLSHYVSSIWVNRSFVAIIIVNCWSTPLIHHLFRSERHESFKKVGCLVLDTLLDIFSSIVVPLVIFLPYAKQFDVAYGDFPLLSYYEDTWIHDLELAAQHQGVAATASTAHKNQPEGKCHSHSRHSPASYTRFRHLSLCSNSISAVPEYFFFANQSIQALELAGNPISSLPERDESIMSEPTMLYFISLGYTNVSSLPVWLKQLPVEPLSDVLLTISAGETPYCRDTATSDTDDGKVNNFVVVDCTVSADLPIKLLYPVEAEREWRKSTWSSTSG